MIQIALREQIIRWDSEEFTQEHLGGEVLTLGSSPVNRKSKHINSSGVSSRIRLFLWRHHWSGSTSDITVENALLSQLNVADLPFQ